MAIQSALQSLDFEYTISSFFRDLASIRQNTFKDTTICSSFREAGIWPISRKKALQKMKIYSVPEPLPPRALTPENKWSLPAHIRAPETLWEAEAGLEE